MLSTLDGRDLLQNQTGWTVVEAKKTKQPKPSEQPMRSTRSNQ